VNGPPVYVLLGNSLTFFPGEEHAPVGQYQVTLEEASAIAVEVRATSSGCTLGSNTDPSRHRRGPQARSDRHRRDGVDDPLGVAAPVGGSEDCGGDDGKPCLRDVFAAYEANIDAIFAELTTICDGRPRRRPLTLRPSSLRRKRLLQLPPGMVPRKRFASST
jgi:hypothetical protein